MEMKYGKGPQTVQQRLLNFSETLAQLETHEKQLKLLVHNTVTQSPSLVHAAEFTKLK
jgi:hypothetical protein